MDEEARQLLDRALAAKRANRLAVVALPFAEKIRRALQLQENLTAWRQAPIIRRAGATPSAR